MDGALSIFLLLSIAKTPVYYVLKKHKKTLKNREKKANFVGNLGPRDTVSNPWPFYMTHLPTLGTRVAGNATMPNGTDKNLPRKACLKPKGKGKGSLERQEGFDHQCSTLAKCHRKHGGQPSPHHQSWSGESEYPKVPPNPCCACARGWVGK